MEYIKFEIDNLTNNQVFCQYREVTEEDKGDLKTRAFPLEKIIEEVPRIGKMVKGLITNIYYEQHGTSIITEKKNINILFLYYLFKKINFQKYVIGSTIPHIYFKDYSKEKLKTPSMEEQNKIAVFLSSVDKKIENISNQLNQSKQFKKSLMQKMFI